MGNFFVVDLDLSPNAINSLTALRNFFVTTQPTLTLNPSPKWGEGL